MTCPSKTDVDTMCIFICNPYRKIDALEIETKSTLLTMPREVHGYDRAKFFKVF